MGARRWIGIGLLIVVLACLAAILPGCNGVVLSAEYSKLLDDTADLSAETARRANAGTLEVELMTAALAKQARTWYEFQCGRDGVKPDPTLPNISATPTPLLNLVPAATGPK